MSTTDITVIIPTYNGEKDIREILDALQNQTEKCSILVVDSSSQDATARICHSVKNVEVREISKEAFNHGRTRDEAFRSCDSPYIVFLTQDAIPADPLFLHDLVTPLRTGRASIAYARQLPKKDASRREQLIKAFNYPETPSSRTEADLSRLGIRTFFFSDSAAAYLRKDYIALGGFDSDVKTNEDMFFAAKVIQSGKTIAYVSTARVFHSHNFSLSQQYHRYHEEAYEIARHEQLLNGVPAVSEGKRMFVFVSRGLLRKGHFFEWIIFCLDCVARLLGYRAGECEFRREKKCNA